MSCLGGENLTCFSFRYLVTCSNLNKSFPLVKLFFEWVLFFFHFFFLFFFYFEGWWFLPIVLNFHLLEEVYFSPLSRLLGFDVPSKSQELQCSETELRFNKDICCAFSFILKPWKFLIFKKILLYKILEPRF